MVSEAGAAVPVQVRVPDPGACRAGGSCSGRGADQAGDLLTHLDRDPLLEVGPVGVVAVEAAVDQRVFGLAAAQLVVFAVAEQDRRDHLRQPGGEEDVVAVEPGEQDRVGGFGDGVGDGVAARRVAAARGAGFELSLARAGHLTRAGRWLRN